MEKKKILEFQNISKSFVGVKALSDVSFSVREGEVHALLGENGAGKSTLMKILSGAYMKDAGKVFLDGQEIQVRIRAIGNFYYLSGIKPDTGIVSSREYFFGSPAKEKRFY